MSSKPNENFIKEKKNHDSLFLACNVTQEKQGDVWFLDSGCSKHMNGNIAMFSNLVESVKSEVTLGTDNKVSIMGKGRVHVLTKKGEKKFITDVYYISGLKYNLISIGKLM